MKFKVTLAMVLALLFCFIAPSFCLGSEQRPRVLHITFHRGCAKEFSAVAQELSLDLETWYIPDLPPKFLDGITTGNALYNVGHERAQNIWNLHEAYFYTFDAIVVSDTAPLSRIFLQNGWKKPLIIWICNRFDYSDTASLDCDFPDAEYFRFFAKGYLESNVTMIAYTEFEHYYAKRQGIETGNNIITPGVAIELVAPKQVVIPSSVNKEQTFFLPPYLNEGEFMDLAEFCSQLGIRCYRGRYSSPVELVEFKGIIHLPYAWSNLAFFENIALGIPYFVPSPSFFKELVSSGNYFHTNLSQLIDEDLFYLSEWYSPEHAQFMVYFDSWEDLKQKIDATDFPALREKIKHYAIAHRSTMIARWRKVFENHFH